ncbi:MAG: glucoamylase family protein, partial [Pseudomonadota bacterium]
MSDEDLLDLVQRQTLRYFWDFGHPESAMARERSNAGFGYDPLETVTTGGTGFGIMAMIAGAERGFLARADLCARLHRLCDYLGQCDTHHGVFGHFYDARHGKIIPFSPTDDGGDLPETSFLMMGLLTARQYFNDDSLLQDKINMLWRTVEWSSHCRPSDGALMWHSSANHPWTDKSLDIRGWNECLVTYVLAAGSPTFPVGYETYVSSWLGGAQFKNGNTYFGTTLPLGPEKGGPLFLSQYSFLGLDPRALEDEWADYSVQVRNHSLINRAHCVANPHGYGGYGAQCWGLSASDSPAGYAVHEPANDLGVISPTAALSAFPFTPQESMDALRHF